MQKPYHYATIDELHNAFKTKELTVKELVLHFLSRIETMDTGDNGLHSVLEINPDVLCIADDMDNKLKNGEPIGAQQNIWML